MEINFSKQNILIVLVIIGIGFLSIILFQFAKLFIEIIKGKKKDLFGYKAKIIYDDSKADTEILTYEDDKVKLIGKPDFVLQLRNKDYIIIDAKSGKLEGLSLNSSKLQAYVQQIINYFLIVEQALKIKVKYGELYFLEDNKRFKIDNNEAMRNLGLKTLYMIADAKKKRVNPNTPSYVKCDLCPYKEKCSRRIVQDVSWW